MADCFEKIANNTTASADISKLVDEKISGSSNTNCYFIQQMLGSFLNEGSYL
jgi:hypothetical protein